MLKKIILLNCAGLAIAQGTTTITEAATTVTDSAGASSTSATNTTGQPLTHTIAVALGGHTFVPDVTLAEVGDVIEFDFYPANHSVVRAEYEYPCIPYEDTGINKVGFFSGFHPVDAVLPDPPKWYITVNDTIPIFFYCGAVGSCINYQMVGVINPNSTTSLVVHKQKAKDSTFMLLPGQPFPSEDQDPTSESASTSSPTISTPTTTHSSAAAATTSSEPSSRHDTLSGGAIAGITIGGAAVALAAAVLLYFCGRQSRAHQGLLSQQVPFTPAAGHMSYVDPRKNMSMHSSVIGPPLPGYAPSEHTHNTMPSPPLVAYAPSEAFNSGDSSRSPGASPQHKPVVPAYSHTQSFSIQSTPHQSMYGVGQQPMANIHEMAVPITQGQEQQSQGGIMNFIRRSSVSKGGVERYS